MYAHELKHKDAERRKAELVARTYKSLMRLYGKKPSARRVGRIHVKSSTWAGHYLAKAREFGLI